MSDNTFMLVGKLVEYEKYYKDRPSCTPEVLIKSDAPDDERFYAMFIVITGDGDDGGIHEVVATPTAANLAWYCIRRGIPGLVKGSIKSFPGKGKMVLLATYVTGYEPANVIAREHFPDNIENEWTLPAPHLSHKFGKELERLQGVLEEPGRTPNKKYAPVVAG
jgi:hypothetical protein